MARSKRKETKPADQSAESRVVITVDNRNVMLAGQQIEQLAGRRVCAGGIGFGCNRRDPHPYAVRREYDDYSRRLRGIKLTAEEAESFYYCRRCQRYQGCHLCVGDVASLVCTACHDWANEISEHCHGRMVPRERGTDAFRIVMLMAIGRISERDGSKLFAELYETDKTS